MTEIETNILKLFLKHPTTVFSKDEILNYAWSEGNNNYTSVVPQAISILRKKLHKNNIDVIDTVKGKGYKASDTTYSKNKKKYWLTILIIFSLLIISSCIFYSINNFNMCLITVK